MSVNMFSLSVACLFTFLIMSFQEQKFYILNLKYPFIFFYG